MGKDPNMHVIPAQTLTVNGNSGALPNLCDEGGTRSVVALLVNCPNVPTGTTPTLVVSLEVSPDGTTFYPVTGGATSSITAASKNRIVVTDMLEGNYRVVWTLTGTTPSFTGVVITLMFQ